MDDAPAREPVPEDTARLARTLDWNLLRTFVVIVDEGGITAAARRLLLRQPSVTNALKRLEDQLGRRLIDRGGGRFALTEAGRLLYDECVEIYGNVWRLATILRDVREEISGHVTIAMASHVVCPPFDAALSDFHGRHPRATLSIEVATSTAVVQAVLQKQASFGVALVHKRLAPLRYRQVFREHFGFFCGPGHRLFGQEGLTLADLRDESFVSFKTDRLTDALRPVALLRAQEAIEDRIVGTSSHLEEVRRMIMAGLGIGPLPIHVVERDVADRLVWRLPPYEAPPAIDIFLVTHPRAQLNRAERALITILEEHLDALPIEERTYPRSA